MNCLDAVSRLANLPVYFENANRFLGSVTCPSDFILNCSEYHDYEAVNIDFNGWGWVVFVEDVNGCCEQGVSLLDFLNVLDVSPGIEVRLHNIINNFDIVSLHDLENLTPDMYDVICVDCGGGDFIVHVAHKDCK